MKFFVCFGFLLCVSILTHGKGFFLEIQDTTRAHYITKDTATIVYNTTPRIAGDSILETIATASDTATSVTKIYRKRKAIFSITDSLRRDSLIQDSLLKTSIQDSLITIDTAILLNKMNLYDLIPFYVVASESISPIDRYAGEKRIQNNKNFDAYIYAYIFLFFLAICINIFQAINGSRYSKNTTLKSDLRRLAKLNSYFHFITLLLEMLLSIGLAVFLNLCIQIFSKQNQSYEETKHFIFHTAWVCFIFFIAKHAVTYLVQNIFIPKQDRFVVLYFYKNMLIYLTSLLYITTCITFLLDHDTYKIYMLKTGIALGALIYVYNLLKILSNISKITLSVLIGAIVYLIVLEIIPYLIFFKLLYHHHL